MSTSAPRYGPTAPWSIVRNFANSNKLQLKRWSEGRPVMPDPEFEEFARDYIRLAGQEKSRELRSRLLVLAREWMHAAMQEQAGTRPPRTGGKFRER